MPTLRIFRLVWLIAAFGWLDGFAQERAPDKLLTVTSRKGLDSAALELKNAGRLALVKIQFEEYTNVKSFAPEDSVMRRIDTLVFERSPKSLGTEVLNVPGTLLDIKGHGGTLILRGLAIQLGSSSSILLSGYDFNRVNVHLVLDSCFIFGDTVSSTFLSWYGGAGSTVKINRSFFVFKQGVASTATAAKMLFNAATFAFYNNLFNYPGILSAVVLSSGNFDVRNNSFNRTQVNLLSAVFQQATYNFNSNYIGYPPGADALGNPRGTCFLKATDFDATNSLVRNTVQFSDWVGGFDHEANRQNWFATTGLNNRPVPNGGKPQGELWNWYAPISDSAGMGSGNAARRPQYNVFPVASDTLRGTFFNGNALDVEFKKAEFPRYFELSHVPVAIPDTLARNLRIQFPELGAVRFGPFQITTLKLSMRLNYGRPVLIAVDSGSGRFFPQRIGLDTTRYIFPNDHPSARAFYFGFQGNTPRGNDVTPILPPTQMRTGDSLVFSLVTAAGMTTVSDSAPSYPAAYRNLGSNYLIRTSAAIPSTGNARLWTRGSAVIPWDSTKVYWWRGDSTEPIAAIREANGKFLVTMAAADSLRVSLIERLNVPRGARTVFPLARGASVAARSDSGYQLRIDSTGLKYDTSMYGNPTHAYSLRFPGRLATDPVTLYLPAGPDVSVFQTRHARTDSLIPMAVAPNDSGVFEINVGPGDSGVKIFSATPYNVRARVRFDTTFQGLEVWGLQSATSGLFQPVTFDAALKERKTSGGDTLPADANLLGGAAFRTLNLSPDSAGADGFRLRFRFRAPEDPTQVQAFAWEREPARWRKLGLVAGPDSLGSYLTGLRIGDSAVLVLEALRPAMDYLDSLKVVFNPDEALSVTARYKVAGVSGPYRRFEIELLSVDSSGAVRTDWKVGPAAIGEELKVPLRDFSGMLKYRIRFLGVTDSISTNPEFGRPVATWKRPMLRPDSADKERYRWHLVGFPYRSTRPATLDSVLPVEPGVKNTRRFLLLDSETDGRTARWDSVTTQDSARVYAAGDGLLFTSAALIRQVVDDTADLRSTGPALISPGKAGWRFVAVPFPMDFAVAKIRSRIGSTIGPAGPFFRLDVQPNPNPTDTARKRVYAWPEVGASDHLEPFKGYAYFFQAGESLIFDPWGDATAPLPKASVGPAYASMEVTLRSGGLSRAMRLVSGPGAREVPFLPSPARGLEMRVGEDGGYAWKRMDNLSAIDLPVRIDAPQAGSAHLALTGSGTSLPAGWRAALLDLATGEVIDPAAQDLSLPAGSSEYRLVAGSGEFVAERLSQFRAGLPTALILSQNTPNPFRGLTRIAVDWPALSSAAQTAGAGRRSYLEVFDARGKRMAKLDLGRTLVGRQWVTVDAARWEPGIYAYRLTVVSSTGLSRLQKRMLVIR